MEAQERDEQSVGRVTKLVKGKVGKPKVKKVHLEETLPSPYGRRVEPPSQPMKSDPAKKLLKKKKVTARDYKNCKQLCRPQSPFSSIFKKVWEPCLCRP